MASNDWYQRSWRPTLAYLFGAQTFLIMLTFCKLGWMNQLEALKVLSDVGFGLMSVVTIYFVGMFGILGVFIYQRGQDKQAENERPPTTGQLDMLGDLIKALAGKKK